MIVLDYNPQKKVNVHEPRLTKINTYINEDR